MGLAEFPYGDIIHRCFRCGYCKFPSNWIDVNNCPAYARYRLETYSCGGRLWLTRAWLSEELEWTDHLAHIVFSCTGCKNCESQCPLRFNTEIVNMINAAKGAMVERGAIPAVVKKFFENILRHGNPYGLGVAKRGEWLRDSGIEPYGGQEYLYYVGCIGSYDTRAQEAARALGYILKLARVSFGCLGTDERCDGNEVSLLGERGLFELLATSNIKQFKSLGVKKIVTLSPHAYNAMKNRYPLYGGDFEVLHYTQLLRLLISGGRLAISGRLDLRVTYHDPCFLGRWNGEYEAARAVLKAIPGVILLEMEKKGQGALCCGGGGGNFYTDFLGGSADSPTRRRVREAVATGADVLAVACPICLIMLADAIVAEGIEEKLAVLDISEIVAKAVR